MTRLSKKIIGYLIASSLACTLLSGCGGKGVAPTDFKEPSKASDNEAPGKLVVWGGVPGDGGPDEIIKDWNAQNPDMQAEYVRYVNDDTGNLKLDTALLSGEQIDVFFTYTADLLQKRTESGMIQDLVDFDGEKFIEGEIHGGMDSILKINNGIYSIPTVNEPIGIMLNQDMLNDKGIVIPENWTMKDFQEISRALTQKKDGKQVYGSTVYYNSLPLGIPATTLGGDYLYKSDTETNFDHPVFASNALLKDMMDEGVAMPYQEIFSRKLEQYSHPGFLNEEIGMMPFSAWMLRYVRDLEDFPHDFVTTFAPFPRLDENTENPYQSVLNNYISMNSNSEVKDEAWEFMKFWVTEGSKHIAKMPAWDGAAEDEIIQVILGDDPEVLFDVEAYKAVMLSKDLKFVVETKTTALPQIMQIYKEESEKFFLGAMEPAEYFDTLKTKGDKALQIEVK